MADIAARPRYTRYLPILGVAFAVRLITVLPALDTAPYSDEISYHSLAARLAEGRGFCREDGRPTSWRPPLWPAVLGGLYRLTGPTPAAGRCLQVLLGTALVGLIVLLAATLDGDPRTPLIAGWWAALSPTLVFYSHSLFSETLFGICTAVGLFALLRARQDSAWRWPALTGVALGLACLCRGSTLLFVPAALVWLMVSRGGRWDGFPRALLAGLLCAATVAPWTVRNTRVHGAPILVDSNAAVNLFYGNHPDTPLLRPWEVVERQPLPWPNVSDEAGEVALQRRALYEAALFVRERPGRFAAWLAIKTGNLWGLARDLPGGLAGGLYGRVGAGVLVPAAALAGLEGLAVLCLAVLGMAIAERRAAVEVQVLVATYLTLAHAVSYGHSRFRFGFLLLAYGFAAPAITRRDRWRKDLAEAPRLRRGAALVVIGLLVANFGYEVIVLELLPRLGVALP